jgi:BspA type Leucine rich repeat region (6 copies)
MHKIKIKRHLVQVCLLWVVVLLPSVVKAQFTFTTNNGAITITGYIGYSIDVVVIPASINGYPVTSIGSRAFYFKQDVKKVVIPDTITNIGDYAFYYNSSLTNINIPSGVSLIADYVFSYCNLTNISYLPTLHQSEHLLLLTCHNGHLRFHTA